MMKVRDRGRVVLCAVLAMCLFAALAVTQMVTLRALAKEEDIAYDVVTDDNGEFVGVNIKNSTAGALSMVGNGMTVSGTIFLATFNIGAVNTTDTDGLLVQFDARHAGANQGVWFVFETDEGALYRTKDGETYTLVSNDGTYSSNASENSGRRLILKAKTAGTYFLPWNKIAATGTANGGGVAPETGTVVEDGTTFVKLHFGIDVSGATWVATNRPVAVGTIAAVDTSGQTVEVRELVDTTNLNYTVDPDNIVSDINLSEKSIGTTVYAGGMSTGYAFNVSAERMDQALSNIAWSRLDTSLKVLCHTADGSDLGNSFTVSGMFNAQTGEFDYTITPESVPSIVGYVFNAERTGVLSGSAANREELVLYYDAVEVPELTVKYIDEEGMELRASEAAYVEFDQQTEKGAYMLTPPAIFGYKYKSADRALWGEITEDTTVTLTYTLKELGEYDVIADFDGSFIGVNLKNSTSGALAVASVETEKVAGIALTTYELDPVSTSVSSGILIQIDNRSAIKDQGPWLILEAENGALYKFCSAERQDVFIHADGTEGFIACGTRDRYTFKAGSFGTLYVPWTNLTATGTATGGATAPAVGSAVPEGTTFIKFHFGIDMTNAGWSGADRRVAIGTIAAVSIDGETVLVDELLNTASLTYSNNASDTEVDVNLADMTKGKVVYSNAMTASYNFALTAEQKQALTENVQWIRTAARITLNYLDGEGNVIQSSAVTAAAYEEGAFVYDITPAAIPGWTFKSSSLPLSGISDGSEFFIDLVYEPVVYTIMLEFVDRDGNPIQDPRTINGSFQQYIEIEPDEIDGYAFVEATNELKFTVYNNRTIRLYYEKTSGGCASSVMAGSGTALGLVIAAGALSLRKRREKKL